MQYLSRKYLLGKPEKVENTSAMYTWRLKRGERPSTIRLFFMALRDHGEGAAIAGPPAPPQSHHIHQSHPLKWSLETALLYYFTAHFRAIHISNRAEKCAMRGTLLVKYLLWLYFAVKKIKPRKLSQGECFRGLYQSTWV